MATQNETILAGIKTGNVLPDLSQVVRDQAAQIESLRAAIEAMRNAPANKITLKVSEKGALSVYGMGRFPMTHYASQWERLAQEMPRILQFIKDNSLKLARKPE